MNAIDAWAKPVWRQIPGGDLVCQHGTAIDVHCCNCHHGFLFDGDSCECVFDPDPDEFTVPGVGYAAAALVGLAVVVVLGGILFGLAQLVGAW